MINDFVELNQSVRERSDDKIVSGFQIDKSWTPHEKKVALQRGVKEAITNFYINIKDNNVFKIAPLASGEFAWRDSEVGTLEHDEITIVGFPHRIGVAKIESETSIKYKFGIKILKFDWE
jgi:hypothetical protein